jgi:hypothetical protein
MVEEFTGDQFTGKLGEKLNKNDAFHNYRDHLYRFVHTISRTTRIRLTKEVPSVRIIHDLLYTLK